MSQQGRLIGGKTSYFKYQIFFILIYILLLNNVND